MSKKPLIETLDPKERRDFLKLLGLAVSSPFLPDAFKFAMKELAMGKAYAQAAVENQPTYFLEINYRDQWDFGQVFVPPGLATNASLKRGEAGNLAAVFYQGNELEKVGNNLYLTNDSKALKPHVDTIAMVDLCELSMGTIHGHEAANAIRSPGRSYQAGAGRTAMFELDAHSKVGGNENHYSSTPTPAVLHNYLQKQLTPGLRNGVVFKGISRGIHTVYHHSASLKNAQPDRYQSKNDLLKAFANVAQPANPAVHQKHANLITKLVEKVDARYLKRYGYVDQVVANQALALKELSGDLTSVKQPTSLSLPLTQQEIAYWSEGVPNQSLFDPDTGRTSGSSKAQIWESCAYAAKLLTSGLVRTMAIEFDFVDWHGPRKEEGLRLMGKQTALPLARLIETFKAAGIYDRTVIVMYTADGGRSPKSDSSCSEGKNGFILAGGMIKGGYYGDIKGQPTNNGNTFTYFRPDPTTGLPVANGTTGNGNRVSGAAAWRTVAKAFGAPDSLTTSFTDAAKDGPLNFLFKNG